jgi:hypothetical protein
MEVRWFGYFSLALIFWLGPEVRAVSVAPTRFEDLQSGAEVIFRGQVSSVRFAPDPARDPQTPYTWVTFHVLEIYKGTPPADITLRFLGGTLNGRTLRIEGAPTFVAGDDDIVFVEQNGKSFCPLVSAPYGRYRIRKDKDGTERIYTNDGRALTQLSQIAQETSGSALTTRSIAPALTLKTFVSALRSTSPAP